MVFLPCAKCTITLSSKPVTFNLTGLQTSRKESPSYEQPSKTILSVSRTKTVFHYVSLVLQIDHSRYIAKIRVRYSVARHQL